MELKQLWEPAVLYPVIGISPREDILSREGSAPAASLAHSPLSPVPAHTEVVGELSPSALPLTGGGGSPVYEGTSMISPSWSLVGTVRFQGQEGYLFVFHMRWWVSFLRGQREARKEALRPSYPLHQLPSRWPGAAGHLHTRPGLAAADCRLLCRNQSAERGHPRGHAQIRPATG